MTSNLPDAHCYALPSVQVFPFQPSVQLHVNMFMPSTHEPSFSQGDSVQSSISIENKMISRYI